MGISTSLTPSFGDTSDLGAVRYQDTICINSGFNTHFIQHNQTVFGGTFTGDITWAVVLAFAWYLTLKKVRLAA
jgi:hypothetical protein